MVLQSGGIGGNTPGVIRLKVSRADLRIFKMFFSFPFFSFFLSILLVYFFFFSSLWLSFHWYLRIFKRSRGVKVIRAGLFWVFGEVEGRGWRGEKECGNGE